MKKTILLCAYATLISALGLAQEPTYTQSNKETEYHYGVIAEEDLSGISEIEKIKYELKQIERSVVKTISNDGQTLFDITINHNDYEQSWMTNLAKNFKYDQDGVTLFDKENAIINRYPYSEEEVNNYKATVESIHQNGYHPGLVSFPVLTPESVLSYESEGIKATSDETGSIITFTYSEKETETYDRNNLTITTEWVDEEGIQHRETIGYEPYLGNKGYLPRISKNEKFVTSATGKCITEVKLIYYSDYEINDGPGFIDKATESIESITVYPNPNDGIFSVTVQTPEDHILSTTVTNLLSGASFTVNDSKEKRFEVNMANSEQGHYVIQVYTDKSIISSHFIKK